ncbi:hypothetical protein [Grimontia indica]|uniref:hypothetical protein n=1 Tax=Grimontia indica TaxID=1056512 RepID=UPI0005865712|nr:hypothetical protein [Grimontia indica]
MKIKFQRTLASLLLPLSTVINLAGASENICTKPTKMSDVSAKCVVTDDSYWMPDKLVISLTSECAERVFVKACMKNGNDWGRWECNAIHLSNNQVWESQISAEWVWYEWVWEKVELNAC